MDAIERLSQAHVIAMTLRIYVVNVFKKKTFDKLSLNSM